MKKFFSILVLLILLFSGLSVSAAGTKRFGERCTDNSECASDDCEDANGAHEGESYCDCGDWEIMDDSEDCEANYGGKPPHGGEWRCIDGMEATYDLDYCFPTTKNTSDIRYPLPPTNNLSPFKKALDFLTDQTAATGITVSNITEDINDKLAIKIPGLNFSKLQSSVDEDGYLYIPWLGEYISAIYNFALAIVSIIAVIMIIMQGVRVVVSGGGEEKNAAYKKIFQVVIGLMILYGSYAILYNLNPALVKFAALRIKYNEPISVQEALEDIERQRSEDEILANSSVRPPGIAGKSPEQINADVAKYSSPFTDNSWCKIKNPSTEKSISGDLKMNFDYFGSLDCLKSDSIRPTSQIETITLHSGLAAANKPAIAASIEKKYGRTISGWAVYRQLEMWRGDKLRTGFGANSHYTIDRDGTIYQTIDDKFTAWHAPAYNNISIGVDLIYYSSNKNNFYTDEQYASLAKLVKYLANKYPSIKGINDATVIGHGDCEESPSGRADPNLFDFEKFGALIAGSSFSNSNHPRLRNTGLNASKACKFIYKPKQILKGEGWTP